MKKLVMSIIAAIVISSVPQQTQALPPDFIFGAHGIVTENGLPVDDASVFVECGPDGVPTGTNPDGSYNVSFGTCFLGSTVFVWASKGDSFGTASVLGTSFTTLNVELFKRADTTITGNVSDHGFVVRGAKVIMQCGALEKEGFTDSHGEYSFVVPSVDCPIGATVKVTASEGSRSGTISTVVKLANNINIAIANVGIPEYGLLSGTLAASAGVGLMAFYRNRYGLKRI